MSFLIKIYCKFSFLNAIFLGQKHSFKSSRGLLYYKYCGAHPDDKIGNKNECAFFSSYPKNHNFISIKSDGKLWEILYMKCFEKPESLDMGC